MRGVDQPKPSEETQVKDSPKEGVWALKQAVD